MISALGHTFECAEDERQSITLLGQRINLSASAILAVGFLAAGAVNRQDMADLDIVAGAQIEGDDRIGARFADTAVDADKYRSLMSLSGACGE